MKIETKFNIGDSVWVSEDGFIINGEIINIHLFVFQDSDIQIRYHIIGVLEAINEKFCFSDKQELLNQLC